MTTLRVPTPPAPEYEYVRYARARVLVVQYPEAVGGLVSRVWGRDSGPSHVVARKSKAQTMQGTEQSEGFTKVARRTL